jgi:6-pyruvoyltetrahydropterin/6-carboxytetrahydropterin synthase
MTTEENRELYGKCNNPYGHGHDYVLHVSVRGNPRETTGRVVVPGALDRFVQEKVIGVYDHRDINSDVPGFQGVPTTENLAIDIERRLRSGWEEHFREIELDRIRIQETPRNTFELTRT